MLGSLIKSLFGPTPLVELNGLCATGEALPALQQMIREVQVLEPKEIRPESGAEFLDVVILRESLEDYETILQGLFGNPAKPFDEKCRFPDDLDTMVDSIGGIDKDQCLYLRRFEDDRILYAALWPWGDPEKITLKLGRLDDSSNHAGH